MGYLKDVKIVSLVIKPEILRDSHFFLLCKAIEYQKKTNLPEGKQNIHIPHPTVKYTMIETFIFVKIIISSYVVTV